MALANRAKVAIGLDAGLGSAERVINSALFVQREGYARPVLVSRSKVDGGLAGGVAGSEIPLIVDEDAEASLVELLRDGAVDAAVRGNLGARRLLPLLKSAFSRRSLCRITVLELGGRLVMLSPVGIDEGETREDLVEIAGKARDLAGLLGIPLRVGVISGGRLEDRGRSSRVDRMLSESAVLAESLTGLGMDVENYGIEIERAVEEGASLLLAPDGVIGNLIFRSLVLVANIESYGSYASALPRTFVDTSRAKGSYLLPLILASALSQKPQ